MASMEDCISFTPQIPSPVAGRQRRSIPNITIRVEPSTGNGYSLYFAIS